jgi:hypothetical protein
MEWLCRRRGSLLLEQLGQDLLHGAAAHSARLLLLLSQELRCRHFCRAIDVEKGKGLEFDGFLARARRRRRLGDTHVPDVGNANWWKT